MRLILHGSEIQRVQNNFARLNPIEQMQTRGFLKRPILPNDKPNSLVTPEKIGIEAFTFFTTREYPPKYPLNPNIIQSFCSQITTEREILLILNEVILPLFVDALVIDEPKAREFQAHWQDYV